MLELEESLLCKCEKSSSNFFFGSESTQGVGLK